MADDATRAIALERLMQRKDAKHKKELDRLHKRIRQLEAQLTQAKSKKPLCGNDHALEVSYHCASCTQRQKEIDATNAREDHSNADGQERRSRKLDGFTMICDVSRDEDRSENSP